MKFLIPQTKELTREVIKQEFFKTYYPEMTVRQGWWKIWGRYVMLQKNPFVCAAFYVKQKNDAGKTQIRIMEDQNTWAYIIGAPIIGSFIKGDFYKDLERNFKQFLTKKYGFNENEIESVNFSFKGLLKKCWSVLKYILLYFALFIAVALIPNLIDRSRPRDFDESSIVIPKEHDADVEQIISQYAENEHSIVDFLTPDIIWVTYYDSFDNYKEAFYGLDGKPARNLTVWAFKNKDSYGWFAVIAAVLFAVILYFRKKKAKKATPTESSDETIIE